MRTQKLNINDYYKNKRGGIYEELTLDSSDEKIKRVVEENREEYYDAFFEYVEEYN